MAGDNIELVRELFERWIARDFDSFMESAEPDVEIYSRFASLGGEPYTGVEGIRSWVREIEQNFERFDVRPSDFRDLGDRVLVLGTISLHGRASGIEIDQPMGWLFQLRNGKLARLLFYSSHVEALEAAGLSGKAVS